LALDATIIEERARKVAKAINEIAKKKTEAA
jgi:hypothetical protein